MDIYTIGLTERQTKVWEERKMDNSTDRRIKGLIDRRTVGHTERQTEVLKKRKTNSSSGR